MPPSRKSTFSTFYPSMPLSLLLTSGYPFSRCSKDLFSSLLLNTFKSIFLVGKVSFSPKTESLSLFTSFSPKPESLSLFAMCYQAFPYTLPSPSHFPNPPWQISKN
ncbi:hypothetical protein QJS10_CPB22g00777 [Acorus calamus]|uniref:Uncharacterized protein n=1 Tax=Acorus calamus TaxID=4465 RepID=A0AAV9BZW6_ACOCL|nr:hypothetical protein QJS10_CPB22g00777 [Acorus calamus]